MRPTLARLAMTAMVPFLALATACGDDGAPSGGAGREATPAATSGAPTSPSPAPKSTSKGGGGETGAPGDLPTKVYNDFAQCMRKHGVHVPDAGRTQSPPPENDPAQTRRALKACAKFLNSPSAEPG